jgi:saccharopine dehydrogenase-like NADP-dependent oxidoreductase
VREHDGWVALVKAGFGNFAEPIHVNGTTVIPGDVLAAVMRRNVERHLRDVPDAESFDVTFAIGSGERGGKPTTTACAVLGAPNALYMGYLDAATSMGLSIGVQLLADTPPAPGVWAPEEVYRPEDFLRELELRHFRVVRDFAVRRAADCGH